MNLSGRRGVATQRHGIGIHQSHFCSNFRRWCWLKYTRGLKTFSRTVNESVVGVQFKTTDNQCCSTTFTKANCNSTSTKSVSIGELEMCFIHWRASFSFHGFARRQCVYQCLGRRYYDGCIMGNDRFRNVYLMIDVDFLWRKNTSHGHTVKSDSCHTSGSTFPCA